LVLLRTESDTAAAAAEAAHSAAIASLNARVGELSVALELSRTELARSEAQAEHSQQLLQADVIRLEYQTAAQTAALQEAHDAQVCILVVYTVYARVDASDHS
jgi:hypothetical protein